MKKWIRTPRATMSAMRVRTVGSARPLGSKSTVFSPARSCKLRLASSTAFSPSSFLCSPAPSSSHLSPPSSSSLSSPSVASSSTSSPSASLSSSPLTDTHGRFHDYLRISLSERCNLRCVYCMPEQGVPLSPDSKLLTSDEIIKLASIFVSQGVSKIRLTGGEPSVRKDFVDIVTRLGELNGLKTIAATTNGVALPRKLPSLYAAGLNAINLSLDTLSESKFETITRRKGLARVLACLSIALDLGIKVKVNMVVMRGINDMEILDFVELTKLMPIDVRFIEYMPFDGNNWSKRKMFTYFEMLDHIKQKYDIASVSFRRGDTAKMYDITGHAGRIGFISSMTSNFCSSCNRLRLTTDGNIKVCLFDNKEVSLRDMLRQNVSDADIVNVISLAVQGKKKEHSPLGDLEKEKNRPMILIGG